MENPVFLLSGRISVIQSHVDDVIELGDQCILSYTGNFMSNGVAGNQ